MSDGMTLVLVLVAGFFTGVLSGMFGVGGAIVSTPAIRALGAPPLVAVGSTLPSIVPSSISGALRYHRDGYVDWRVVAWTGCTGGTFAVLGALAATEVPGDGHLLMILTAGLVGFTAFRMTRSPSRPDPADAEELPPSLDPDLAGIPTPVGRAHTEWWRLALIGLGAGLLSGLLGIGGGLLMVPAFTAWVNLDIKAAIGTSLACVGILAIPGMITHQLQGNIDWFYALPLSIAVIPGARLGAHLAIRASDRGLRLTVATILGGIAVLYAVGEVVALIT
ncbi:MAG: sulfite exporter TauE/SafE family protein [Actinobacteria bacterium]|nr:sulfite exporter TauE/SafE family protein [Actinomycetota bacterium]